MRYRFVRYREVRSTSFAARPGLRRIKPEGLRILEAHEIPALINWRRSLGQWLGKGVNNREGIARHPPAATAQRVREEFSKAAAAPAEKEIFVMEPTFFATSVELREWLRQNHAAVQELWVGLYKKGSGKPSITWPELVDQLLCFGWIDGVRRSLDEDSYMIRVTPRRARSIWSVVNTRRAQELIERGLMQPSGLAAFAGRDEQRSNQYSFEREQVELGEAYEAEFRQNREAWEYFQSQPPSYRKAASGWVVSAKREETRCRRLATLIADSGQRRRIALLRRAQKEE